MKKPVLVAIWIVATLATTAVAYVAVNAAGAEVTDRPLTSVVATGATTSSSSTSTTAQSGTSTTSGSGTTGPGTPGTSSATGSTTTTASTSSTATTATTASEAPWQQATIPSKGGLVIVSYRPGEVRLESVAPTPGFSYEIDDAGPPEVRVRFEGGDVKVDVRVRWDDGLVTEVDEDS